MKDIPGIDEDGNPKNGPFKLFFKNGLISCQGEFDNGKKSGKWKYASRTEKLLVGGNGSIRVANLGERAASTIKNRSTVNGPDTMPMANSGTKVALNTVRRRVRGRFTMRRASS
jgi:hypothetical protein